MTAAQIRRNYDNFGRAGDSICAVCRIGTEKCVSTAHETPAPDGRHVNPLPGCYAMRVATILGTGEITMNRQWNELLMDDHRAAEKVIAALERGFENSEGPEPQLIGGAVDFFTNYLEGCHHQKEEQHLFPLLEQRGLPRHGGPLSVMLMEHEQNRKLLAEFRPYSKGDRSELAELRQIFQSYSELMKQHFWKENDTLYPMGQQRLLDQA